MATRRVVITGIGVISPLGNSAQQVWEAIVEQRSGIRRLETIPTDHLPLACGGEARDFHGKIDEFGPLEKTVKRTINKGKKLMCREIQMGVAAAQLALHDAGLDGGKRDPERTGVVFGSDYIMTLPEEFTDSVRNCIDEQRRFEFDRWASDGISHVDPLWLLKYLPNMPASHIAIYNDLRGPNNSITLREASSNLALLEAYCTISRGGADAIIAGATGTRVHPLRTVHVILQEELATNGSDPAGICRPFDQQRTGMVMGEGAGALVLEELAFAEARGASILGEVIGYGSSTVMDRSGGAHLDAAIRNVLQQALRTAGLQPEDIGHIHAHGLATRKCDQQEAAAISAVFGPDSVPVTALKSYMGNLGAGGGVVETVASLQSLHAGQLAPVLNYETPDPDCPIAVNRELNSNPGQIFINLNVTPQGQASAIVVRKF